MKLDAIPADWTAQIGDEFDKDYFAALKEFVAAERAEHQVFPPEDDVFNAFSHTPFDDVKVVILGQDPYHGEGQAHGLAFSVLPGVRHPPSLRNIFKEMETDIGTTKPADGTLTPWADQGVFLLNTCLTVRAHEANSHRKQGWETFTDRVIEAIGHRDRPVAFVLWGKPAQTKKKLIDTDRHTVIESPHPSPLSAKRGFFGSQPFSTVNAFLEETGQPPIEWQL